MNEGNRWCFMQVPQPVAKCGSLKSKDDSGNTVVRGGTVVQKRSERAQFIGFGGLFRIWNWQFINQSWIHSRGSMLKEFSTWAPFPLYSFTPII